VRRSTRLAGDILGHDVRTVPESGWAALKNGELLARAEREFEVFVTVDRNLPVVAVAERRHVYRVLTTDRRDFSAIRVGPRLTQALELLP